jgi:hypothetical protein
MCSEPIKKKTNQTKPQARSASEGMEMLEAMGTIRNAQNYVYLTMAQLLACHHGNITNK